ARHLAHRLGQRQHVLLLHVARDHAGEVTEAARVREARLVWYTDLDDRAGVAADARPREAERRLDVLLPHHMVDGHHAAASLRDEIPRDVRRIAVLLPRDLRDG